MVHVKDLDPRRIIKIQLDNTCFGYYYFETRTHGEEMLTSNLGNMSTFFIRNVADVTSDIDKLIDPKTRLIVDLFARNISRKLDKKFIENNKEFKTLIYELVKQEYIVKKQVNIIYLQPNDIEHLMVETNKDGYGISRFKKIVFTAKLYLAVLTTTLMMKISRSADHRTFYIETGLSKDPEETVQSFVREIKSKEIKLYDLTSIDTIFQSIGQLIMELSLNFFNCWKLLKPLELQHNL